MTPLNTAMTELTLAVQKAEQRALLHMAERHDSPGVEAADSDHRTAVAGDIADAIDRIVPGLGLRFMSALHPHLDLTLDEDLTRVTAGGAAGPLQ